MTAPQPTPATILEALRGVLAQVAEPIQVLRAILDQAITLAGADRGVFVEVDGTGELNYRVLHRVQRKDLSGEAGQYSRSIFAGVLKTGRPVRIDDALSDPRFMSHDSVQEMRLVSVLCMPIRSEGRIAALVHLERNRRAHFQDGHLATLGALFEIAGPILEALRTGRQVLEERDRLRVSEGRFREEIETARETLAREWSFGRFIGKTSAVLDLEKTVRRAGASEFPVLLVGETGTGKSLVARVLHHAGPRSKRAFVTVFCPSLERGMVEAELFGHKKGAFTGAVADRIGKVQAAEKGTLLLDEIGELPLEIQPKLLRLLQERTYERVGDPVERLSDVRVIAATNRDLEEEVHAGRFRRDLFERLNFIPIRIPPLRERVADIPLLLRHFLDQHDEGRWIEIESDGLEYLTHLDFAWPGNIRHLEQLAARLALEGRRGPVSRDDLARLLGTDLSRTGAPAGSPPTPGPGLDPGLPEHLARAERLWLEQAILRYPGLTRSELARRLGIAESTLYKKLRQHDLGG